MNTTARCYHLSRGRKGPVRPEGDGKPSTPCGDTEGWGWEAGAGKEVEAGKRKDGNRQTYFPTFGAPSQPQTTWLPPPPPFYCCGRSSKVSGSREGLSGEHHHHHPPPRPQHTQRLFFCIEFLLPSSHCISCQEAQSRPFPTYDPGTLGPKRWKKVMYQFIALRRCCAWPLLLEN